jgi:hypothetical protein
VVDAVARLDWPADRLEIQSWTIPPTTRATSSRRGRLTGGGWASASSICAGPSRRLQGRGRCLAEGLKAASGEFGGPSLTPISSRPPTFSKRPSPIFMIRGSAWSRPAGVFCTRRAFRGLPECRRSCCGPHFSIEHQVRFRRGLFFNFNGTAGIWRRRAIAVRRMAADTVHGGPGPELPCPACGMALRVPGRIRGTSVRAAGVPGRIPRPAAAALAKGSGADRPQDTAALLSRELPPLR